MLAMPASAAPASFADVFEDPALIVACILLMVVAVAWVIVSRMIVHNLRKAARRRQRTRDITRSPRDIWADPPPKRRR
jgi:hypothetical protein